MEALKNDTRKMTFFDPPTPCNTISFPVQPPSLPCCLLKNAKL